VKPGPVLVVPCLEAGRGGGHLIRSLALVRDLRALGREAWLYPEPGREELSFSRFCEGFSDSWRIPGPGALKAFSWAFIVLDRFKTPEGEFRRWAALAPLIGLDEGGPRRRSFDFLIDLLPGLNRGANIRDPSLIPLPKNRRPLRGTDGAGETAGKAAGPLRILVSFGAEDPAGLASLVCRALGEKALGKGRRAGNSAGEPGAAKNSGGAFRGSLEIDKIAGLLHRPGPAEKTRPLRRPGGSSLQNRADSSGVRLLPPVPGLGERLGAYDLLITHYGLTAFEALYAGLPVLLVSPGPYHEKLAKRAGFFSAGIGRRGARRAASLLFRRAARGGGQGVLNRAFLARLSPEKTAARHGLDKPRQESLAERLNKFTPLTSPACPGCGSPARPVSAGGGEAAGAFPPVLARFPRRTYRRCPRCGLVYMERLDPPPIEYGRDYFFEFYKKQYGKTYLEDFPGLIAAGRVRLNRIRALLPGNPRPAPGSGGVEQRLLDIGCAYGPFLVAAGEAGFIPLGIDPAEDAVRHIRENLGLEAHTGFFPETDIPALREAHSFDAVCLWYVIEHFRAPRRVLAEARRLLRPGGVLAFSTPSFSGVSGRKNRGAFLEKSPPDHWTLWSPQSCGRILKKAGFRLRRIYITGHHPERFPLLGRFIRRIPPEKPGALYGLLLLLSRIFRLGDTFEAYAAALPEHTGKNGVVQKLQFLNNNR
jgi:SAM-dependent methyltransferase